jgi:hypothetical protein
MLAFADFRRINPPPSRRCVGALVLFYSVIVTGIAYVFVIPAQAGIPFKEIPAFAGMTKENGLAASSQ